MAIGHRRWLGWTRVMALALILPAGLAVSGSAGHAASCPSSIEASSLVGKFRLVAAALKSDAKDVLDVDTFYFYDGACECSFGVVGKTRFSKKEISAALRGPKGLKALTANLKMGKCPSVKNTWSPYIECFRGGSPVCKGLKKS